ncbi:MAG: ATP-binding cassette domain-containing protein [Methanomicrobiales archaeon]
MDKIYRKGDGKIIALHKISAEFIKKELSLVVGPSGSGKSTLMRIIGLLESPSSGTLIFNGTDIKNIPEEKRLYFIRNEIGFVPPYPNLLDYLTLLENVMLPMNVKDQTLAIETLKKLGVDDIHSYPQELSTEFQLIASIARAIINKPKLILIDEPTFKLSKSSSANVMELIKSLKQKFSIITFTDDINLSKYSDTDFNLNNGILE